MRILLDENMPESVRRALVELGHDVDYPGFSRDRLFVHSVRTIEAAAGAHAAGAC